MNKATIKEYGDAIHQFATDLQNCICDEDRRDAVIYLARKIGVGRANIIAEQFGLTSQYYKANTQTLMA